MKRRMEKDPGATSARGTLIAQTSATARTQSASTVEKAGRMKKDCWAQGGGVYKAHANAAWKDDMMCPVSSATRLGTRQHFHD
jgi:hypothetical protein